MAGQQRIYVGMALVGTAWLLVLYVAPMVTMFWRLAATDGFLSRPLLSDLEATLYLRVYVNTFQVALFSTVICLILGYLVAFALSRLPTWVVGVVIPIVLMPFWISLIVRTYALLVVLGRNGAVNAALMKLGFVEQPLQIMFTSTAVYIGMAQALLPFMILTIFNTLRAIDPRLAVAARSLGASDRSVFTRIIFPMSLPGVWAGSLLVFILSLGFYVTPALLGGPRDMMVAQLIQQRTTAQGDFTASILLSIPLFVITVALVVVFNRFIGLDRIWGGSRTP